MKTHTVILVCFFTLAQALVLAGISVVGDLNESHHRIILDYWEYFHDASEIVCVWEALAVVRELMGLQILLSLCELLTFRRRFWSMFFVELVVMGVTALVWQDAEMAILNSYL